MAQTGEQPRGDGGGDGVRHSQGHRETRNEEAGRSPPESRALHSWIPLRKLLSGVGLQNCEGQLACSQPSRVWCLVMAAPGPSDLR